MREVVKASRARSAATRRRAAARDEISEIDPVARVLVDLPLAHLDRPFDYAVPAAMASDAVPGCRVKVRFAGQDVDGFLLARTDETDHGGRLQPLRRVVSAEPVLSPAVADLSARLAERYAGTRSDVLAARGPATARHHREGSVAPRPDARRRPGGRASGLGGPRARRRVPRPPRARRVPPSGVVGGARDRLAAAARPRRRHDVLLRAWSPACASRTGATSTG